MRILLVSLHFVEYAAELAGALSCENRVHLVFLKRKVPDSIKVYLEKKGIEYTLLDKYKWKDPAVLKNLFAATKLVVKFKPDIIHFQESRDISNIWFLAWGLFIPVIGTVHDVMPHPGTAQNYGSVFNQVKDFIRKNFYKKIIVHGEAVKEELLRTIKRKSEDIFIIPHGCLFSFHFDDARVVEEEDHTILFFGRIEEYKGLKYLIEAEKQVSGKLPDFKILIAGRGRDLTLNKDKIKNNPHYEIREDYIPNEQVMHYFKRSSVVVLPYIEASQSGVVAMAFAFGKPVIVTDVGSLPEAVINGKTGFVVSRADAEKLGAAILELLKNKELRKRMGKAAYDTANNELSWKNIAGLTMRAYKETIG